MSDNTNSKDKYDFVKIKYTPKLILEEKLEKEVKKFIDRINNEQSYANL
jgi:hypothetical protein